MHHIPQCLLEKMSWERLGRRFETSRKLFGGRWRCLLRPLAALWKPLEASWTAVGRLLELGNDFYRF